MQKVMDYLSELGNFCSAAGEFERGFQTALILAALVFLLLIVLGLILKICFRKPAVPGVTLEREDGNIFISRNAICNAITRLEEEFTELEIIKVVMLRNRRRELELAVNVEFEAGSEAFDAVAGALKQRIFVMLNKSFGIDTIKSISINLIRIPEGRHQNNEHAAAAVGNNGFISGI